MKTTIRERAVLFSIVIGILLCCLLNRLHADTAPALNITLETPNEVMLTITNGVGTNVYEIYYTEFLSTDSEWTLWVTGLPGQTNFLAEIDETETGYFKAVNGNDWDSDGIFNAWDARPYDPGIGLLTVTIESPANGSNVQ